MPELAVSAGLPARARGLVAPGGTGGTVEVQCCPHPFTTEFRRFEVGAGLTVTEILERVQPRQALRPHAHVWIGPHKIPRRLWRRVRPNPGVTVFVRVVPQGGGGKNPLRIFLMLAVVALSVAAPFIGGTALGLMTAKGGITLAGALVSSGIGIVGNLLVNALVPPPRPQLGKLGGTDRETSPTLSGARNQPIPFGVVPRLHGRFKQTPPLAGKPFTELVGDDQYLRMAVSWGVGLRHFELFRIGTTLLSDFNEVEIETRRGWHSSYLTDQGNWDASSGSFPSNPSFGDKWTVSAAGTVGGVAWAVGDTLIYHGLEDDAVAAAPGWDKNGDQPLTLYATDPHEQGLAIELPKGSGPRIVTTQPDTDSYSFDVAFLQGLLRISDGGKHIAMTRQFLVEESRAGAGDWTTVGTLTVRARKAGVLRRGFRRTTPARGQYDVRITPIDASDFDDGDTVFDLPTLTALRSFTHSDPFTLDGEAKSALRIKATGQLQGVVDQLNSITTSVIRDWDSANETWVWRPTQNPASHYREVLQGIGNARALPDSKVDLTALQDWHEKCTASGWNCNVVVDFEATVGRLLQDIAATGRAAKTLRGGKWSVVIDEAGKPTVGHFTPRNTSGLKGTITYPNLPHAFRVRFRNEDADFEDDERIVYDDGYDASNATVFETLQLPFITDPDLIWKHGRYHIAQARLRRESWTWSCDVEHVLCTRGDRSVLAHDVLTVGLAYPRIKSLTTDSAGDVTAIEVDEELTMTAGKDYALVVRTLDKPRLQIPLVNAEDTVTTVTPAEAVAAEEGLAVGDLVTFGELGEEVLDVLVTAIEPGRDMSARITAQAYATAVHEADQGAIPPHTYQGRATVAVSYPIPILLRSDGSALIRDPDGSWQSRILVSYTRPSGLQTAIVAAQARFRETEADADGAWTVTPPADVQAGEISILPVEGGLEYEVQFRWVLRDGSHGDWSPSETHLVIGKEAPPSNVVGFSAQQNGAVVTARWEQIPDLDLAGYTLRYGAPATPWRQGDHPLTAVARGTQVTAVEIPPGVWDLMIKAQDTSGNESATEARVRISVVSTYDVIERSPQWPLWPGLDPQAVTVEVVAEDEEDWLTGTLTNATVAGDGALEIAV